MVHQSMVTFSQAISRVQPSPTILAAARAEALRQQGRDIISLTVGEPDFDTPQHIKDGAIEALKKGFTKYTAVPGIVALRQVIAEKLKREQHAEYALNEIVVTCGGKQALASLCSVLLNPGDEAIIPAPYWTSYPDMVRLAGGEAVIVNTRPENGYRMTPEELLKACTPRTKLIFLNTPSNPTGACYSGEDLKALAAAFKNSPCAKHAVIVTDEVYEYITFDGFEHQSIITVAPELRDQIVIVNAFSKAYSMTGWRVGYAAGPKPIIEAMCTHQSQVTTHICSIAQHAAAAAYTDNSAFPKMMAQEFLTRCNVVCDAIEKTPGLALSAKPQGAFFAFPRVEGLFGRRYEGGEIRSGQDFTTYLLEKYNVAVVQGEAFGDPGAVRLSFALAPDRLKLALTRIQEAVSALS